MIKRLRGEVEDEAAFPVMHSIDGNWVRSPMNEYMGMSLRDYFAAKAMQGLLAQSCGTAAGSDPKYGAEYAYAMADAMLAERNKEK